MDESGLTQFNLAVVQDVESPSSETSAPSPLYFIMLMGGIPGAMLQLSASGTRIGRAADNTLQLPENSISRYHALLRQSETGELLLTDLGSTNGTFINGKRLPEAMPIPINDGDRIQFGTAIVVKFVRPDPCEERFQREMFERSVRDSLTGLFNRGYFLSEVGGLGSRSALRGLGMAVLMVDIDHFKQINDTYGHDAGDRVLKEVAGILRQSMRGDDLVARFGGEEFVVALPVAAPDQAAERAERIRASLAERRIVIDGRSIWVTASIGVSYAPAGRPHSVMAMISAADRGLYQAKSGGRDRVVFGVETRVRLGDPDTAMEPENRSTPMK